MSGTGHGAGWKFTVSLPLWINAKDDAGQDVVLYRVNVHLQGPGMPSTASAPPGRPPFFVLRRYSQFRYLYDQLRAELPDIMRDRVFAPPPKLALHIGGMKEMCDRRRQELEAWMWKLIGHPAIARSAALKAFLEWDRALSKAQAAASARALVTGQQGASSSFAARSTYAGSDMGDLDSEIDGHTYGAGDAHSEISSYSHATGFGSGRMGADLHTSGRFASDLQASLSRDPTLAASSVPELTPYSVTSDPHKAPPGLLPAQAESSMGGSSSVAGGVSAGTTAGRRLGIKLENRADVRRLMQVLQGRLEQAGSDLQAAGHEVVTLREANKLLTARLDELETAAASAAPPAQAAALKAEVDELHNQLEAVRQELAETGARAGAAESAQANTELQLEQAQEELERAREELSASEDIRMQLSRQLAGAEQAVAGRVALLTSQVASLQQQLQESHQENTQLLSRLHEWGITSSSQRVSADGSAAADASAGSSPVKAQTSRPPSRSGSNALLVSGPPAEALAALQARLLASEQAHEEAMAQLAGLQGGPSASLFSKGWSSQAQQVQAALESEKAARETERTKAREHQTLLAREVKKLRGELAAQVAKQQAAHVQPTQQPNSSSTLSREASHDSAAVAVSAGAAAAGALAARSSGHNAQQDVLATLQHDKGQLQQQLQGLQQGRDHLQQALQGLQHEHARVQSELQLLQTKEVDSQTLQEQALEAGQRLHEAEQQLQQAQKQITEQEHAVKELQQELDEAMQKIANMAEQAAQATEQQAAQMGELTLRLQQQQEDSARKLQEAEQRVVQQEMRVKELQDQLNEATQKVAEMADKAAHATEQQAAQMGDLTLRLQQQQEDGARTLQDAEERVAQQELRAKELQSQLDEATQKVAEMAEKAAGAAEEGAVQMGSLTLQLQQQQEELTKKLQEAEEQLKQVREEAARHKLRIPELEAQLEGAQQHVVQLSEQVAAAAEQHTVQDGGLAQQLQQQEEAAQKLQVAEQQLQAAQAELVQHQQLVESLQSELDAAMQKMAEMAEQVAAASSEHAAQIGRLTLQSQQQQEEAAQKLQEAEQQLQLAQEQVTQHQQRVQELEQQLSEAMQKVAGMADQAATAVEEHAAQMGTLTMKLQQQQEEAARKLQDMEQQLRHALVSQQELEQLRADADTHTQQLEGLRRELQDNQAALLVSSQRQVELEQQLMAIAAKSKAALADVASIDAVTGQLAGAGNLHDASPLDQAVTHQAVSEQVNGQAAPINLVLQVESRAGANAPTALSADTQQMQTERDQLQAALLAVQQELEQLKREKQAWESESKQHMQQRAGEHAQLETDLSQLKSEKVRWESDAAANAVLQQQAVELTQQLQQLLAVVELRTEQLSKAEHQVGSIELQLQDSAQKLQTAEEQLIQLSGDKEQLQQELAELQRQYASAQEQHAAELASHAQSAAAQSAAAAAAAGAASGAELAAVQAQHAQTVAQLEHAQQQLQQLQQQAVAAERLKGDLAAAQQQLHVAQQQLQQQQHSGDTGSSQLLQDLESQLSHVSQQLTEAQQQLQQQAGEHDSRTSRLEGELADAKSQLQKANQQLQEANRQLEAVQQQLQEANKQLEAAQQQLQQGGGIEDEGEVQHIKTLQQELAAREEALKQQEVHLQALASQVSAHTTATAAALANLSPSQSTGTLSRHDKQHDQLALPASQMQPAAAVLPADGSAGDDLLMLFDEPAGSSAGGHRTSSMSGGGRLSNGSDTQVQPPDLLTGGMSEANGGGQASHAPLASLRSQASMLRAELATAQQKLLQVAADRDKLRQQLVQAKSAQVAGRNHLPAVASSSPNLDESWTAQLTDVLQRASALLSNFKTADTAPALRHLEQAISASAQKAKGGGDAVAAAADAAMDTFLLALSGSNDKLEELNAKVRKLHEVAGDATTVSLLDPAPEPVLKLQAQLVSLLSELLTAISQAYSALNELRCEKAMNAAAAVASSITQAPTPRRQAPAAAPAMGARTASGGLPSSGVHSQSAGPQHRGSTGVVAPQQPMQASVGRQGGVQAGYQGPQGNMGSGMNAVSNILGGGLFGSSSAAPNNANAGMTGPRGPPMAQSGVLARWMGGLQGATQQPQHVGGQRADSPGGYVPPKPVDGDADEDDLWQSLVKKAGH